MTHPERGGDERAALAGAVQVLESDDSGGDACVLVILRGRGGE